MLQLQRILPAHLEGNVFCHQIRHLFKLDLIDKHTSCRRLAKKQSEGFKETVHQLTSHFSAIAILSSMGTFFQFFPALTASLIALSSS